MYIIANLKAMDGAKKILFYKCSPISLTFFKYQSTRAKVLAQTFTAAGCEALVSPAAEFASQGRGWTTHYKQMYVTKPEASF